LGLSLVFGAVHLVQNHCIALDTRSFCSSVI
jgi:hypothetical protein